MGKKSLILILALLFPITSAYAYVITVESGSTQVDSFGADEAGQTRAAKIGQKFTTVDAGNLTQFTAKVNINGGSPSDNVVFEIYADSGGSPSGSALGSGTTAGSGLANDPFCSEITITPASFAVTASTTYWIVISRSGSQSLTNNYGVCGAIASGAGLKGYHSSWVGITGLTGGTDGRVASTITIETESTSTSLSSAFPFTLQDFTFTASVIIFMLALIVLGLFYSLFKRKR